jgi:hypothetical protein
MRKAKTAAIDKIIASTINETARGDPDALASRIVAALAEAGYSIVPTNGIEPTGALPSMQTLYRSPNGDTWFLARDPETGAAFVRHQANAASGAQVTDLPIEQFLSGPESPERDALLRVIGASILNPREAEADEPTGREWSDPEMKGLGEMLVRGVSIEEIAVRLRRDKVEVRDKVAEVGRACRWGAILRGGQTEEGSQPRAGNPPICRAAFQPGRD